MDRTGLIEPVLVGFGDRHLVEMDEIPVAFRPYIRAKRVRGMLFLPVLDVAENPTN